MPNVAYIGTSLDGYIAEKDGGVDFLQSVPNPENDDLGFQEFMTRIDALLMGRNTYETVLGFGGTWPYKKPVFVLSNSLSCLPEKLRNDVELVSGPIDEVVQQLRQRGFENLYVDGGKLIQSFLHKDMIDELIIAQIPVLLGGGTPLFGELDNQLMFEHVKTEVFLQAIVQSHYKRAIQ